MKLESAKQHYRLPSQKYKKLNLKLFCTRIRGIAYLTLFYIACSYVVPPHTFHTYIFRCFQVTRE